MKAELNLRFAPVILTRLILIILIWMIPSCFCQNNPQYETCRQTFECGSLRDTSYPFWGGTRPAFCGYPGFELSCQGDVPLLNISSTSYRLLDVDNQMQTIRVARNDLWDNLCPTFPFNTTLNFTLYDYSPRANDQNITLFYGCTLDQQITNQFNCDVNGTNSRSFYLIGEAAGQGTATICSRNIYVPVNRTAAQALANPTTPNTSIDLLQSALRSGFSVHLSADNENCNNCVVSRGLCGSNEETGSFACYCIDGPYDRTCNDGTTPSGNNGSKKGLSDLQTYVVIGVSLGIAAIVISSIITFYIRKQCRLRESNQRVDKLLLNYGSLAPKRYTYSEIKKITKSFADKLGQGGYGIVYKGELPDGQLVAVKVLTETNDNGEEFINEVASISRTSHVNIVNLLGFCYDSKRKALVCEFMPNKSLDRFIYKSTGSDSHLEWETLYKIAVGVARGLEYLHIGCNTRIVHFDIKPQNILLDEDFCPKISDFGLAKLVKKQQSMISMAGARGTIGYIAPEVFSRNFGGVSHKSDIYSYGMMLLEMAGGRKNAEIEAIQSSENYFPDKIYEHVLLKNEKLDDDDMTEEKEETSKKMLLVGLWCIQTAPADRPSMTKVVEMLEGSLQSIEIPPKPTLFRSNLSRTQFSSSFSVSVEIENAT